MSPTRPSLFLIVLCIWLPALPAAADIFFEVQGARSQAMGGAHRGLANSNEAVLLNPGGLPLTQRYSIDVQYDYGSDDRLQHGTASVVDSKTGPVSAGVVYTRDWGNPSDVAPTINRSHAAVAYRLGSAVGMGLSLGNVSGTYRDQGEAQKLRAWSSTLGVAANLGFLGLGAVYHNAYRTGDPRVQSPALGFGSAARLGMLTLAADLVVNLREDIRKSMGMHAGAELFVMQVAALRLGFKRAPAGPAASGPLQQAISGGVGLINSSMGLNITFERTLGRTPQPRFSTLAAIQFFL